MQLTGVLKNAVSLLLLPLESCLTAVQHPVSEKHSLEENLFFYNTILPCLFGSKSHYVQWVLLPDKWL